MRKKKSAAERNKKYKFTFLNGDTSDSTSELGPQWIPMYTTEGTLLLPEFTREDFEIAMLGLIQEPGINSNAILRADILKRNVYELDTAGTSTGTGSGSSSGSSSVVLKTSTSQAIDLPQGDISTVNVDDIKPRRPEIALPSSTFYVKHEIVRRLVPRNPMRDPIINQTCLILNPIPKSEPNNGNDNNNNNNNESQFTSLVIWIPHLDETMPNECPYYLPNAKAAAILFCKNKSLSIHYTPFSTPNTDLTVFQNETNRLARTAYKLLLTSFKHSTGTHNGYEKRVNHDVVVDRAKLQNRYLLLKQKYSGYLMEHWVESTDPKKHVYEDLLIAAFLLELWARIYGRGNTNDFKDAVQFRDLGCGNGVLVFILVSEGVKGYGVDARERKTWSVFPQNVRACLKERVIVPSILINDLKDKSETDSYTENFNQLLASSKVETTEFPRNTFIIGNHSDELTCWIPLLGYPFLVIPCCSYSLSGLKCRYNARTDSDSKFNLGNNSTYAGLVDHVDYLAERAGWAVEREMLRIPSTRNAAVIGYKTIKNAETTRPSVAQIIMEEGGAGSWVQNTVKLMNQGPRSH